MAGSERILQARLEVQQDCTHLPFSPLLTCNRGWWHCTGTIWYWGQLTEQPHQGQVTVPLSPPAPFRGHSPPKSRAISDIRRSGRHPETKESGTMRSLTSVVSAIRPVWRDDSSAPVRTTRRQRPRGCGSAYTASPRKRLRLDSASPVCKGDGLQKHGQGKWVPKVWLVLPTARGAGRASRLCDRRCWAAMLQCLLGRMSQATNLKDARCR